MSNVIHPNMYPTLVPLSIADEARKAGIWTPVATEPRPIRVGPFALALYNARHGSRVALLTIGSREFTFRIGGAK